MTPQPDLAEPVTVSMTLQEQADFILGLHDRMFMSDGAPAAETLMMLTKDEAAALYALGHRLARIAPHERAVRALVMGR